MRRHQRQVRQLPRRRCPRAAPGAPGPAAPPSPPGTRRARRSGCVAVLTIWRDDLVSGFIVATMSTIWKRAWRAAHDRLLAGDQDHRHRAEMRIGGAGDEVQRARGRAWPCTRPGRPVSRPWVAAMNAADCSCRVSTSSMLDVRKRLDDVEVLLAGHAEDALDALVLQRCHQQVGSFGHGLVSPKPLAAARRLTACAKSWVEAVPPRSRVRILSSFSAAWMAPRRR